MRISLVRLPIASMAILFVALATMTSHAQTYTVLNSFNRSDGSYPSSTLIFDRAGNLYGTTEYGGAHGDGVVFQLKHTFSGGWIYSPVHQFNGNSNVYLQ